MGVGAGLSMYVVVVQKFTFAISSPDEFLYDVQCVSFCRSESDELHLWRLACDCSDFFANDCSSPPACIANYHGTQNTANNWDGNEYLPGNSTSNGADHTTNTFATALGQHTAKLVARICTCCM